MTRSGSLLLLLPLLAACGSGAVVEFSPPRLVSKDQRPTTWDAPSKVRLGLPDMSRTAAAPTQKRWVGTTPAGWEQLPAEPARFRDAIWRVAGEADTECYLSVGVGGGVAMNMSRWYTQQFGIEQVPSVEALPVVDVAGRPGRLVELTGTFLGKSGQAVLLAFYTEGERVTSLKFSGPEAVVLGNKDKFLELARSLRQASASTDPEAPPIQPGQPMPPDHPTVPGQAAHGAPAPASPFVAETPASWQPKAGSSRPLHFTFGTDGEVYVSQLGGDLRPTFDVWRSEVGLAAMTDDEWKALASVPMCEGEGRLLDVAGDFQSMSGKRIAGARLLVAAFVDPSGILFVKLVGPAAEVEAERTSFERFCASLRRAP